MKHRSSNLDPFDPFEGLRRVAAFDALADLALIFGTIVAFALILWVALGVIG